MGQVNKTVRDTRFRSEYSAAIVGIHRNGGHMLGKIGDVVLQGGSYPPVPPGHLCKRRPLRQPRRCQTRGSRSPSSDRTTNAAGLGALGLPLMWGLRATASALNISPRDSEPRDALVQAMCCCWIAPGRLCKSTAEGRTSSWCTSLRTPLPLAWRSSASQR